MRAQEPFSSFNVTVMRGVLHRPPQWRELPTGDSVTMFDLKLRQESRNEFVRVSWRNAPTTALQLQEGEDLVVTGRVRSYWAGRRSETDVLAQAVVRATPRQVRKHVAASMALLQEACT